MSHSVASLQRRHSRARVQSVTLDTSYSSAPPKPRQVSPHHISQSPGPALPGPRLGCCLGAPPRPDFRCVSAPEPDWSSEDVHLTMGVWPENPLVLPQGPEVK